MHQNRYRILLVDADETLLDFSRAEKAAMAETLTAMNLPCGEEIIARYHAINDACWKKLERGEATKKEILFERMQTLCASLGEIRDPLRMNLFYAEALGAKPYLLPGAMEFCQALHAAEVRLSLITNGTAQVQHRRLAESGLSALLSDVFISEELGAEKPSPAFFDAVVEKIPNFDPTETLVFGDSLTSDMAGGIAYGLDTCWFHPRGGESGSALSPTYIVHNYNEALALILG